MASKGQLHITRKNLRRERGGHVFTAVPIPLKKKFLAQDWVLASDTPAMRWRLGECGWKKAYFAVGEYIGKIFPCRYFFVRMQPLALSLKNPPLSLSILLSATFAHDRARVTTNLSPAPLDNNPPVT